MAVIAPNDIRDSRYTALEAVGATDPRYIYVAGYYLGGDWITRPVIDMGFAESRAGVNVICVVAFRGGNPRAAGHAPHHGGQPHRR